MKLQKLDLAAEERKLWWLGTQAMRD